MNANGQTETQAVAELAKRSLKPQLVTIGEGDSGETAKVLLVPNGSGGFQVTPAKQFLDPYRLAPERRRGTAKMHDLASFIVHVNRFKDEHSALFAMVDGETDPRLVAVLDYHEKLDDDRCGSARFGDHRSQYEFPISDEWKTWLEAAGDAMSQSEFAEFIERRLVDVADPSAAGTGAKEFASLHSCAFASASGLLALSRGLSVRVGSKVAQAVSLQSGETTLKYETEHQDERGAPLKVPGAFLLALPVFRNGARYQIPVRLRYRVSGPSISWSFELYRHEAAFDHAVKEACDRAQKETQLPVFYGSPES